MSQTKSVSTTIDPHLSQRPLLISGMGWRKITSTSDIQIWTLLARYHSFRSVILITEELDGGDRRRLTAEESKEG
ncbi:hypothetical protein YC2023_053269 [Brassica napus]|uniref:(rape) hypothetical protein n=1 Tax=Brassica napus TaxID=3708 RepID=A0A816JRC9_BRANA|nr:unnamed protein product [Brassica napus]